MHMRWTDHACNMINNFVCFMLGDMRVPCTTTQPTSRVRMGCHKSHAMLARAQSEKHDDASMRMRYKMHEPVRYVHTMPR